MIMATFLNLDAIWFGLADDAHARSIMDWIAGVVSWKASLNRKGHLSWRSARAPPGIWTGTGRTLSRSPSGGSQVQDSGAV